jgi:hypothetical protein
VEKVRSQFLSLRHEIQLTHLYRYNNYSIPTHGPQFGPPSPIVEGVGGYDGAAERAPFPSLGTLTTAIGACINLHVTVEQSNFLIASFLWGRGAPSNDVYRRWFVQRKGGRFCRSRRLLLGLPDLARNVLR